MFLILYVLLASFLSPAVAAEIDLNPYEASIYSPNGEDGVLARIFASIKPSNSFYVECGAYDGITNSLTYLLRNQGWKGVMFDKAFEIPNLNLHKEFIRADNVNALFQKYNVPEFFDLLTIDIGYNDFYVWQAVDPRYQPSVVCIAYNAFHKPEEDKIVLHHPYFCGDHTNYFGASILALYELGRAKGYTLVYAEQAGQHLFFVRNALLEQKQLSFKDANDVAKIYRPPEYEIDPSVHLYTKNRKYVSSREVIK